MLPAHRVGEFDEPAVLFGGDEAVPRHQSFSRYVRSFCFLPTSPPDGDGCELVSLGRGLWSATTAMDAVLPAWASLLLFALMAGGVSVGIGASTCITSSLCAGVAGRRLPTLKEDNS